MSFVDSSQMSFKFFKTIKVFFADVASIFQELFEGRLYVLAFKKESLLTKDAKRIQLETVKLLQCFDKQNLRHVCPADGAVVLVAKDPHLRRALVADRMVAVPHGEQFNAFVAHRTRALIHRRLTVHLHPRRRFLRSSLTLRHFKMITLTPVKLRRKLSNSLFKMLFYQFRNVQF